MSDLRILDYVYDRLMAAAGFCTVLGLYGDLIWHVHNRVDTFFTAPHALLYSGLLLLMGIALIYRREPGSRTTLLGLALFAAGGVADLIKHQAFGIERDFDALLSPTHLALGFGVAIAICSPIRSAAALPRPRTLLQQLPMLIALAGFVELIHWVTNPFFPINAASIFETPLPHQMTAGALTLQTLHVYEQGGGLLAMLMQAMLVCGPLLYALRVFDLRPGSCTIITVLGTVLIAAATALSLSEYTIILAAALASGVSGDAFIACVPHLRASRSAFKLFAVTTAMSFGAVYLLATALTQGLWWDTSFAVGALLLSGAFALFLSYLALPDNTAAA